MTVVRLIAARLDRTIDVPAAIILAYLMLYVILMIPMAMLLNAFWDWAQNWRWERLNKLCDATTLSNGAARARAVLCGCGCEPLFGGLHRDIPRAIELHGREAATYNLVLLLKRSEASYADSAFADECFERLSSMKRVIADTESPRLRRLITHVREQNPPNVPPSYNLSLYTRYNQNKVLDSVCT